MNNNLKLICIFWVTIKNKNKKIIDKIAAILFALKIPKILIDKIIK